MIHKKPVNTEINKVIDNKRREVFLNDIRKNILLLSTYKNSRKDIIDVHPGEVITRTFFSNCIQIDKSGDITFLLSSSWNLNIKEKDDCFFVGIKSPGGHICNVTIKKTNDYIIYYLSADFQYIALVLLPSKGLIVSAALSYGISIKPVFSVFVGQSGRRVFIGFPVYLLDEALPLIDRKEKCNVTAPITLEFGKDLLSFMSSNTKNSFSERISSIRRHILMDIGILLPSIRIKDNLGLKKREFLLSIKEIPVASGEVYKDRFLAIGPPDALGELEGRKTQEPTFNMSGVWITDEDRQKAEQYGCIIFDPISVIATLMTEVLRRYSYQFLGLQETEDLLNNLLSDHPAVMRELNKSISLVDFNIVLKSLLLEDLSIRDFFTICEAVIEYSSINKDVDNIVEYVRKKLCKSICRLYMNFKGELYASVVSSEIENFLAFNLKKIAKGKKLCLNNKIKKKFLTEIESHIELLQNKGLSPVIICSSRIRLYLKRFLYELFPSIIVLSFDEIAPGIQLKPVSFITFDKEEQIDYNDLSK